MKKGIIIKKIGKKGKGIFVLKDFKKGEIILHKDLTKLKTLALKEISKLSKKDQIHSDYVGNNKYVVDHSLMSHINHSCNPNTYVEFNNLKIKNIVTLKSIKKSKEITHDYTLSSVDQYDGKGFWRMKCN